MNRFAKIMQALGWTGVALLVVVAAQGYVVRDNAPELARHSTLALAAACFCILPRFWTVAYLALAARGRRELRRGSGAAGAGGALPAAPLQGVANPTKVGERAVRMRHLATVVALFAIAALAVSFALAGAILVRRASPLPHGLTGFLALALQVAALLVERRALLADAEEMAAMAAIAEIPPGSPPPTVQAVGGVS